MPPSRIVATAAMNVRIGLASSDALVVAPADYRRALPNPQDTSPKSRTTEYGRGLLPLCARVQRRPPRRTPKPRSASTKFGKLAEIVLVEQALAPRFETADAVVRP